MLRDRVEAFISGDGNDVGLFYSLLRECISASFPEGLLSAKQLFGGNYHRKAFTGELIGPAAATLLIWGQSGIQALVEAAEASGDGLTMQMCLHQLATIAAGSSVAPFSFMQDPGLGQYIEQRRLDQPELVQICRHYINGILARLKTDEALASVVGSAIGGLAYSEVPAARELFTALSYQWMTVSNPVIDAFERLITEVPEDEKRFQTFLTKHPQILDPTVVQIWPQANIFGSRFPDFLLRRADGTYLVVEIECPAKPLVVSGGQLSAHVTHAEAQVADYRSYLATNLATMRLHFPNFEEPECLVITGLERDLSARQKTILSDANRHRHRLRVVGFDWLIERSRTIATNLARHGVETIQLRIT